MAKIIDPDDLIEIPFKKGDLLVFSIQSLSKEVWQIGRKRMRSGSTRKRKLFNKYK